MFYISIYTPKFWDFVGILDVVLSCSVQLTNDYETTDASEHC